jgi:3-oxoacyl-(acyl-carrier-protein) synthase
MARLSWNDDETPSSKLQHPEKCAEKLAAPWTAVAERSGDTAFATHEPQYPSTALAIQERRGASLPAALQDLTDHSAPLAMSNAIITAANPVTSADLPHARLGQRFGRMDLTSQLALLAVEPLADRFDSFARDRIAVLLAARTSSLSTDVEYWKGRDNAGGPSPTLFTYTLPSAALGEIAIRHRLTGPGLCFVGAGEELVIEAADLLGRGEADACVCVIADVVSPALAEMISTPPAATAHAFFVQREENTPS